MCVHHILINSRFCICLNVFIGLCYACNWHASNNRQHILTYLFAAKSESKNEMKSGYHLAKLWARVRWHILHKRWPGNFCATMYRVDKKLHSHFFTL